MRFRSKLTWAALASGLAAYAIGWQHAGRDVNLPPLETDRQAFLNALKPRNGVPVVAVLALNAGTETTDFLVPYAILQRAGVAKVVAAAPQRGRVTLMPALEVDLPDDLAALEQAYPGGADYVVVPAMHLDDDAAILDFIRSQASKGAIIVGICSGARVLGKAGLLDGRKFTGHWYDRSDLSKAYPKAVYVPNRRYLADGGVVTTTGVTATLPTALALVEAIGGNSRAAALADELGLASWGAEHESAAFSLNARGIWTYVINMLSFWQHENKSIRVQNGADDVQLALSADAWSRTHLASVTAVAESTGPVRLRSGLALIPAPDTAMAAPGPGSLSLQAEIRPAEQLDRTLCEIGRKYGAATRDLVALEMEYQMGGKAAGDCGIGIER